eukprot:1328894-Amorphochlora_amoeboformis.AAC.1
MVRLTYLVPDLLHDMTMRVIEYKNIVCRGRVEMRGLGKGVRCRAMVGGIGLVSVRGFKEAQQSCTAKD